MKYIIECDVSMGLNKFLNSLINIIGYAVILLLISTCFKTIYFDNSYYGIYILVAALIIYIFNLTIKPILFRMSIPIIGLTFGLFYPCINIVILKLTDFILGTHFETRGIITLFFTVVLISIMNLFMNKIITKLTRKGDINESSSI